MENILVTLENMRVMKFHFISRHVREMFDLKQYFQNSMTFTNFSNFVQYWLKNGWEKWQILP